MQTQRIARMASLPRLFIVSCLLAACGPAPLSPTRSAVPDAAGVHATATPRPTAAPPSFPVLTLRVGEPYFRLDGQPTFIFSRNVAGLTPGGFEVLAEMTHQTGGLVVRVGVDNQAMGGHQGYGYTSDGLIIDTWSDRWEHFFDVAEANGLYVLPYFTGWMNWNPTGFNTWSDNPLNASNGGPAVAPSDIFRAGSPTQTLYVQWFKSVIDRWQHHRNILAWEVFTEVNYVHLISESEGVALVETLAQAAREADAMHRPTTASLADVGEWRSLYRSSAVEFINFHPYPPSGKLDSYVLPEIRRFVTTYNKPVLIGESGLNAAEPDTETGQLTLAPNARIGLEHAIWAEAVSGAMNGRALFWEDGYGVYFPELGMPWIENYSDLETPALKFMQNVDMTGFRPVPAGSSPGVFGAALGNERMIIAWYRDIDCEPPDWSHERVVAGERVSLFGPGPAETWKVEFYSTRTGDPLPGPILLTRSGKALLVPLPGFTDSIAFKLTAQP